MNRRSFVYKSILFSATIGSPIITSAKEIFNPKPSFLNNFGIQLYSVKDEMEKDPKATLKKPVSNTHLTLPTNREV